MKRTRKTSSERLVKRPRQNDALSQVPAQTYCRSNEILSLAASHWRSESPKEPKQVSPLDLTILVYRQHITSPNRNGALASLDDQAYFQLHLWPEFCSLVAQVKQKDAHHDWVVLQPFVMSMAAMFNYRRAYHPSRGAELLQLLDNDLDALLVFVEAWFRFDLENLTKEERCLRLKFLCHLFRALDYESVQKALLPLLSLPVWVHLSEQSCRQQTDRFPFLRKPLSRLKRRARKRDAAQKAPLVEMALYSIIRELENAILKCDTESFNDPIAIIAELLSLLSEMLSQLRFRRTLLPLLSDRFTLPLVKGLSLTLTVDSVVSSPGYNDFARVLDQFAYYVTFPLDPVTGDSLPRDSIRAERARRLLTLQRVSHSISHRQSFPATSPLRKLPMANHSIIGREDVLQSVFRDCEEGVMNEVVEGLGMKSLSAIIFDDESNLPPLKRTRQARRNLLIATISTYCAASKDILEAFKTFPLMVNEDDLWGSSGANMSRSTSALPVLNLEYLNLTDYLWRNISLFKLESSWAVREDIEADVLRMQPSFDVNGVKFDGWAKMAAPIKSIDVTEVGNQRLDSPAPSHVKVNVEINLGHCSGQARHEWSHLQQHEVIFLLRLQSPSGGSPEQEKDGSNFEAFSNCQVRGFVTGTLEDINGEKNEGTKWIAAGSVIRLTGTVDSLQYYYDSQKQASSTEDVFKGFNIAVRRRAQINNSFPVLSSLRALLLSEGPVLPRWLEDVFLGRSGNTPTTAGCTKVPATDEFTDFADTFVSADHVLQSFPYSKIDRLNVKIKSFQSDTKRLGFKLSFGTDQSGGNVVEMEPYRLESRRPMLAVRSKQVRNSLNKTFFNINQVAAIRSGISTGLTLISGPPGTGKTSCVVQILSTLYMTQKQERILLVTRTNHALNDLIRRTLLRGVSPFRVLRLGQGAAEGAADKLLSKDGRVRAMLERRMELLSLVAKLATSLDPHAAETNWSCESAVTYFKDVVEKEWERFLCAEDMTWANFPFRKFLEVTDDKEGVQEGKHGVITGGNLANEFQAIAMMFEELKELRFLEVLRTNRQRGNYLITSHASIVAMTCVHAAMQRDDLISQRFAYDTLIMEEAAECLEVEAFLSLLLQKPGRLKRVILVGDHKQLPPVVQYSALLQFSNMGQSLFARLVRTGTKFIQLDHQGRSRPSIADLFRWRYPKLQDMEFIRQESTFSEANPGFLHTAQFVDTGDQTSESQPLPYFYQNVAEAEYVAFTFLYMRMVGYPADRIAVLSTYNGQVQLLKEVISARSSQFGNLGCPAVVSTVDKFQGQQADYVLLSLVRTKHLGHFRDVRRITVAMSRARFGLYLFGHLPLLQSSMEFKPVLSQLNNNYKLVLVANETFPQKARQEYCETETDASLHREVHSPADMASIVSHLHEVALEKKQDSG